jgi:hypothetical protein
MKKRNGFVSNSSSSSFIVTFPKKPESKEELAEIMGDCHPLGYTRDQEYVLKNVWEDLQPQLNNPSYIADSILFENYEVDFSNDLYDYQYRLNDLFSECLYSFGDAVWNNTVSEKEVLKKFYNTILEKINESEQKVNDTTEFVARFHYSDEGSQGDLEHGEIFRNLEHRRISHH